MSAAIPAANQIYIYIELDIYCHTHLAYDCSTVEEHQAAHEVGHVDERLQDFKYFICGTVDF